MEIINFLLTATAIASTFGAIAGTFYGVRQRTIIQTFRESNEAYKDQNIFLKEENLELKKTLGERDQQYIKDVAELRGRISTLENIKTPPFEPLMKKLSDDHKEVMKALGGKIS